MTTNIPTSKINWRDTIINAYRMDETNCINQLISTINLSIPQIGQIIDKANQLVIETRAHQKRQGKMDALLHQYDLSTEEGIALMCLAEALLRIPDKTTMDKFISDKLSTAAWEKHISKDNSLFINAATWSLVLTGKIYSPTLDQEKSLFSSLKRTASQIGIPMLRLVILQMMKAIGNQFVMGQQIESATKRAKKIEGIGYRFSYDMLGEAARTAQDAEEYYRSYFHAIQIIGKSATANNPIQNPGISVKLSALHPRYEYSQRERVLKELPPKLLALAQEAKKYQIGLTVDAEEADRLDLSLDIFERVFQDSSLNGWEGLGLAVQAYQKRAFYVIDWLRDLAMRQQKRMMVRLVKGAYWDAEIKMSQVLGLENYPVFTRKNSTDVSYLACAQKLLTYPEQFFVQFGTHNSYSVAAIMALAKDNKNFEFQCLHGMGRPLYDQIIQHAAHPYPVRIYAPVGTHKNLLGYLVRRLLENGANSSFINSIADVKRPLEKIVYDPVARISALNSKPHPGIPLPKDIYGNWQNSAGIDLSNPNDWQDLKQQMEKAESLSWQAKPLVYHDQAAKERKLHAVTSPSQANYVIGEVSKTDEDEIEMALQAALAAEKTWGRLPVSERADILERAAQLFQAAMPELVALLNREAGKCIPDCIGEVRETIDYCRYYAYRARLDLTPQPLPGPTGEDNQLSLHPRGTIACISPWNFPLAIFAGQALAALAAGNPVLAKPAEQTPLIAYKAVQLLHQAGVPKDALQLLIGSGSMIGPKLTADERVKGVMFTGSTETAKRIEQSLAKRSGPIALLIAETGGQNAMIVDSSALIEQTIIDIANSAFNSAGQRCSALRVLFVQEDIAPKLLDMLKAYMNELVIGDPSLLSTDIGPVIDQPSLKMLQNHFAKMHQEARLVAQVPMSPTLSGSYFAPCVFELNDLSQLTGEVFGPILHVIRYAARDLDQVIQSIIQTGYGLTLGIHSRIEHTIQYIIERMPVGNIYVNRNMIGAVVGVQPFGGERLSGTGPKAGGPHYLPRLCVERTISNNATAMGGNARLISLIEED